MHSKIYKILKRLAYKIKEDIPLFSGSLTDDEIKKAINNASQSIRRVIKHEKENRK